MKKKTMAILSIVLVVALTAVGFAAWLIVGTIEGDAQGSFISNEFEDKYFTVDVSFKNDVDDITFGTPTGNSTGGWLTYADSDAKESLSVTAVVTFTPDQGFVESGVNMKDMAYYLTDSAGNYRTIRVALDIFEGESTTNYKWFDMGVELGYIANPTAFLCGENESHVPYTYENAPEANKLKWFKPQGVTAEKFENCYLYIELTKDMFTINYVDGEASVATAEIQIDFDWGTVTGGANPYTYFNAEDRKPGDDATVNKYLTAENVLAATVAGANDATAKTIRTKDLASRMISYLRDHINYDSETETGLQFSITLSEGAAQVVTP